MPSHNPQPLGERMSTQTAILTLTLLLMVGCATVSQTNSLQPGIQPEQARAVLGEPSQTQFVADKWIWKYRLHQMYKGFVPYYLIFDAKTHQLQAWYADEAEYMRQQQLRLQALPPTQNVDVTIRNR
jgi:hypothetical protein